MTLNISVTDDKIGRFYKKTAAIADRLGKSLNYDLVMRELQQIHDGKSNIIQIDDTGLSGAMAFVGHGCEILEEDERSLALKSFNPSDIRLETMLIVGEKNITNKEKQKRLKSAGYIRLGAKHFQALCEYQDLIPENWKEEVNGSTRYIFFDGTKFRDSSGHHVTLCLYWADGRWCRLAYYCNRECGVMAPSAILR